MKTKDEIRHEFRVFFHDLKAQCSREGIKVFIQDEWVRFLEHMVDCGEVPAEAPANWKL